jgi:hypothetical protein
MVRSITDRSNFRWYVFGVLLVAIIVAAAAGAFEWHARNSYLAREAKLREGLSTVNERQSATDVIRLLGEPTFREQRIQSPFVPFDPSCRGQARSALIYQDDIRRARPAPRRTIVVFLGDEERVVCVERVNAMRFVHE